VSDPLVPPAPGDRLLWRPAALLLLGGGAGVAAVGLATLNPVPLFLAVPLLLAPLAGLLEAPRRSAGARLDWSASGSSDEVRLSGRVAVDPDVPPELIDVTFYRPEPLAEDRAPRLDRTRAGLAFDLAWRAPYPCLVTVPKPELRWRDRLGLVERRLPLDGSALWIERFPPEVARIGAARLRRTTPLPGEVRSKALGGSGEFFAIRSASPQDTARQINWAATARRGRLLANDYQLERTGDLLLLLDTRPTPLGADRDSKLLAISSAAALGIATGFLAEKSRVGLGVFDEFLHAVPLGAGRIQRYRLQRALERVRLAPIPGPSERFAVSLRRYFPPGVTTVLLSTLADESSLLLLSHLRRRGYPATVLSASPLPLLAPDPDAAGDEALALRLLTLVRRLRVSQTWREAPVIDWTEYWSLAPFTRFLNAPTRGPGGW